VVAGEVAKIVLALNQTTLNKFSQVMLVQMCDMHCISGSQPGVRVPPGVREKSQRQFKNNTKIFNETTH